jgi:hypothetical protein
MTSNELENKINTLSGLLDDFGQSNFNSKDIWGLQREIFQDFKVTNFYDREERQNNWNNFQSLTETLRRKQNEISAENEKFANKADQLLEKIKDSLGSDFFSKTLDKAELTQIQNLSSETFELIKQNRFPSRERRISTWDKFNELKDRLRKKEDEYYSSIRNKIAQRNEHSEELTKKLIDTIDACHPDINPDEFAVLIGKIGLYLTGIGFLLDLAAWLLDIKDEKPTNILKRKAGTLRDVRKFIKENRDSITREDRQKIYERLNSVQEDLDNAWTRYKEELQKRQHEWEERKKLNEQRKIHWEKNQREFLSKLENRLESQITFKEKLKKIYENQKDFLKKLQARLNNQQDYLNTLNNDLEELEDKYSGAWNDDFKDKCSGWIDKKKDKISEVENDIDSIEDKIKDVERNIDELPEKISEVKSSINELENKIDEVKEKL